MLGHEDAGGLFDPALTGGRNGVHGCLPASAGLYLHEGNGLAALGDQVDLAGPGLVAALQDTPAGHLQGERGPDLCKVAKPVRAPPSVRLAVLTVAAQSSRHDLRPLIRRALP